MHQEAQKLAARAAGGGDPNVQPLTMEVMTRTSRALDVMQSINARLYELRDRLFGSQLGSAGSSQHPRANNPSGFADAFRDKAMELEQALFSIDQLSSEIANRL